MSLLALCRSSRYACRSYITFAVLLHVAPTLHSLLALIYRAQSRPNLSSSVSTAISMELESTFVPCSYLCHPPAAARTCALRLVAHCFWGCCDVVATLLRCFAVARRSVGLILNWDIKANFGTEFFLKRTVLGLGSLLLFIEGRPLLPIPSCLFCCRLCCPIALHQRLCL